MDIWVVATTCYYENGNSYIKILSCHKTEDEAIKENKEHWSKELKTNTYVGMLIQKKEKLIYDFN